MDRKNYQANIDFAYIYRCVMKNLLMILMCASLVGTFSYIFFDYYLTDTYTYSVKMAIVPRDNASTKLTERTITTAVTRCLNVLNSDTMHDRVYKTEHADKLSGTLKATAVLNTNMFTMSATSSSAEEAFRLLQTALEVYPTLSQYFESGYLIKNLSSITGGNYAVTVAPALRNAVLVVLLVVFAGIGLTGYFALHTDKIHNLEQGQAILDMDLLGNIPMLKKKRSQKAILITDDATPSFYDEAVDKVVTEVREKLERQNGNILMVTSIKENDGKSTLAANIALNLANRGKNVLLMDCDMRRPAVIKIFEYMLDENEQLSKYLKGECKAEKLIQKIEEKGRTIYYIGQKKSVAEPDKLLDGDMFKNLLKALSVNVDYIILDTPPIGIVRDAELIAPNADAILMVLKEDEVHAGEVNDVIDMLEETGATVAGGVLNMTSGENLVGKNHHYYGKYYSRY